MDPDHRRWPSRLEYGAGPLLGLFNEPCAPTALSEPQRFAAMPVVQVTRADYEVSFAHIPPCPYQHERVLQVISSIFKIGNNARYDVTWKEFVKVCL